MEITKPVDAVKELVANYQRNFNKAISSEDVGSTIAAAICLVGCALCEAIIYHADTTKPK